MTRRRTASASTTNVHHCIDANTTANTLAAANPAKAVQCVGVRLRRSPFSILVGAGFTSFPSLRRGSGAWRALGVCSYEGSAVLSLSEYGMSHSKRVTIQPLSVSAERYPAVFAPQPCLCPVIARPLIDWPHEADHADLWHPA